jgi:hypothetical protein
MKPTLDDALSFASQLGYKLPNQNVSISSSKWTELLLENHRIQSEIDMLKLEIECWQKYTSSTFDLTSKERIRESKQ